MRGFGALCAMRSSPSCSGENRSERRAAPLRERHCASSSTIFSGCICRFFEGGSVVTDANGPMSATSPFVTVENLRARVVEAVLGQARINHAGLNAHLWMRLAGDSIERGALIGEPVIEGAAAYETGQECLSDLAGGSLTADTVAALTAGADGDDYRFDLSLRLIATSLKRGTICAPLRRVRFLSPVEPGPVRQSVSLYHCWMIWRAKPQKQGSGLPVFGRSCSIHLTR